MVTELTQNEWILLANKLQDSNFFYDKDWLELTAKCFRLENHYFKIVIDGKNYSLVVQKRDGVGFCPFIGYVTILSEIKVVNLKIVIKIRDKIEEYLDIKIERVMLHPKQHFSGSSSEFIMEDNASVPLKNLIDTQMKLVHKKTRTAVKFSFKNGVTTRPLEEKEIIDFYRIYLETMERVNGSYRTPVEVFQGLLTMKNALLLGAFKDELLISGSVFFIKGGGMYYWWNCSNSIGKKYCGNYAIIYDAIRRAISLGCIFFDMSTSHSPEIELPKLRWGAKIEPFYKLIQKNQTV